MLLPPISPAYGGASGSRCGSYGDNSGAVEMLSGPSSLKSRSRSESSLMWRDYSCKVEASAGPLARDPLWQASGSGSNSKVGPKADVKLGPLKEALTRSSSNGGDWADSQFALDQRRRALRRQFRDGRTAMPTEQKRSLVGGLVSMENSSKHMAREQQRMTDRKQRIKGLIRDCSRPRMELVDMQKMMSSMVEEPVQSALPTGPRLDEDLKTMFSGLLSPMRSEAQ